MRGFIVPLYASRAHDVWIWYNMTTELLWLQSPGLYNLASQRLFLWWFGNTTNFSIKLMNYMWMWYDEWSLLLSKYSDKQGRQFSNCNSILIISACSACTNDLFHSFSQCTQVHVLSYYNAGSFCATMSDPILHSWSVCVHNPPGQNPPVKIPLVKIPQSKSPSQNSPGQNPPRFISN